MAQLKLLNEESLNKELLNIGKKRDAVEKVLEQSRQQMNEAYAKADELKKQKVLFQTLKETIGETAKVRSAYARGLAQGMGIVFADGEAESSLLALLEEFALQDASKETRESKGKSTPRANVIVPEKPKGKRGRPPKVKVTESEELEVNTSAISNLADSDSVEEVEYDDGYDD